MNQPPVRMKTTLRILLASFLFAGSISADQHEKKTKTVRIGLFPMEPVLFLDETGAADGFIPDLIHHIFPVTDGWNPVFVSGSWAEGHQRLQDGEIDLMPCTTWTEERAQSMEFTREIAFESWGQISVPLHSKIDRWQQLQGKTVAVMAKDINGQNFKNVAAMLGIECAIAEYPTHHAVFAATEAGEADAAVTPQVFAGINTAGYHLVPTTILFSPSPAYFVSKKGTNTALLAHIDERVSAWKEAEQNSPYYDAVDRWLGASRTPSTRAPTALWITLAAAAITALALFGANRILQQQVSKRTRELADKQQRLSIATEAGGIGVWEYDLKNNHLYCDDRMLELYGIRKDNENEIYEIWTNAIHPDDKEQVERAGSEAIQHQCPLDTAFKIVRSDGAVRHIRAFGKVLCDSKGSPDRIIGTNQDITDTRKTETELQSSQQLLNDVIDAIPDLLWLKDQNGKYLLSNRKFETLVDSTKDKIRGRSDYDLFPKETADSYIKHDRAAIQNRKTTANDEPAVYQKDGRTCWIETLKTPLYNHREELIGVLGIGRDISWRKNALEQTQEQQELLSRVMDNSPIPMWIGDSEGTILRANPAVYRTLNLTEEQIVGKYNLKKDNNLDNPELMEKITRLFEQKQPISFECSWETDRVDDVDFSAGKNQHIHASIYPLLDENGNLINIVAQWVDISEQKRAEQTLKEHNAELEQFNRLATGRELRMIELKQEVNALCRALGRDEPYA